MRRFLIPLFSFLFLLIPSVLFSNPTSRESFTWDGTKITEFIGEETEVVIPDGTTEIGGNAFYGCSSLTSVVIPEGVTTIEHGAFSRCSSLTSVVIPNSVVTIGRGAFAGCTALKKWPISPSHPYFKRDGVGLLTKNGKTLVACLASATEYRIPDGVMQIKENAFSNCSSLTSLEIPDSVKEIEMGAFVGCTALKEWKISSTHSYFKTDGISLLTKDGKKLVACPGAADEYQIPKGVTRIESWAFSGCSSLTSVVIPEGVTDVGWYAFSDCRSLTSVVIPKSMTTISVGVFAFCSSLTSVEIPEGVTVIGPQAFDGCSSLTSVVIPESVKEINFFAFRGCRSLTSVEIPEGVTEVDSFADCPNLMIYKKRPEKRHEEEEIPFKVTLDEQPEEEPIEDEDPDEPETGTPTSRESFKWSGTKIAKFIGEETEVVIPDGTTEIGWGAFRDCSSLKSVVIPEGVTDIGGYAFADCSSLTSVVIPKSVTMIEESAFRDCRSLTFVKISEGVKEIGFCVFSGCSALTSIEIPEGVTKINWFAFDGCSSLTSIRIPMSMEEIYSRAFANCSSLNEWSVSEDHPCFKTDGIGLLTKDGTHLIACLGTAKKYRIPEGVKIIERGAFSGRLSLTSVTIPDSVKIVFGDDFANCPALKEWSISSDHPTLTSDGIALLTKDGKKLIACPAAEGEYRLPEGVTVIGDSAFKGCASLTSIVIPEGVTLIDTHLFEGCSSLVSIEIPGSVTDISYGAFIDCPNLTIHAPAGSAAEMFAKEKEIPFEAIQEEKSEEDPFVDEVSDEPESETPTSRDSFEWDGTTIQRFIGSETEVVIPDGTTGIGLAAFQGCDSLKSVKIPKTVKEIGNGAFAGCNSLTSIVIPKGVKKIGIYAFGDCSSLKSVAIPKSLKEIGAGAFAKCPALKKWSISASHRYFKSDGAGLLTKDGKEFIACRCAAKKYTVPEGVTTIRDGSFAGCSSLKSIVIPASVTTIGEGAFFGCGSLKSITIPASVTTFGEGAFYDCPNLTIHAPVGSAAEKYAKENKIPFKAK